MYRKIYLKDKKEVSLENNLRLKVNPEYVYIPLINFGILCTQKVKKDKVVKIGDIIGIREDIDFPILSPVSGIIKGIEKKLYINNSLVDCVKIKNDFKNTKRNEKEVECMSDYTKEQFIDIIKNNSVIGMSGNDFPTFIKYKGEVRTLIVNAVECEPYLTCDYEIVMQKSKEIFETIDAIMKINNIDKTYIAVKSNNKDVINILNDYCMYYENIFVKKVGNYFSMGYEREIIKKVLKTEYDKLPIEKGIVVNNIYTIYSMYRALKYNEPLQNRIVTLSGELFRTPINLLLTIGTDMSDIFKKVSKMNNNNIKLIAGGPMMGKALSNLDIIVTKNLTSLLVINNINDEEKQCLKCGKCLEVCPMGLSPIFIKKALENKKDLSDLNASKCIECGLCSYICPSKIKLRDYVVEAKEVRK